MNERNQVYEIDFLQLAKVLWKKAVSIVLMAILGGLIAFGTTYYFITPLYSSDCMFYVNNSIVSVGSTNFSISSADISAAQSLVDTYIVILKSRSTIDDVIKEADLDMTYSEVTSTISAAPVNSTEIFKVTVTTDSPEQSKLIANTIAEVLPKKVSNIIEGSSVRIVDYAVLPSVKTSPSFLKNTAVGVLAGAVFAALIIIVGYLLDDIVREEDFLTSNFDIPMLAVIPNLDEKKSKSYYKKDKYGYNKTYGYDKKHVKSEVDFSLSDKNKGGEN